MRKIVQIDVVKNDSGSDDMIVFGLADDGSLWWSNFQGEIWNRYRDIPGGEIVNRDDRIKQLQKEIQRLVKEDLHEQIALIPQEEGKGENSAYKVCDPDSGVTTDPPFEVKNITRPQLSDEAKKRILENL